MSAPDIVQRTLQERIAHHLATLPGEIGCRYLARDRDDVPAPLLVDLKLVKPIVSRVPTCQAHDCPLVAECEHEPDFHVDASGSKSGVKYKRTAAGDAVAAGASGALMAAVEDLPLARIVLARIGAKPMSILALHAELLEEARALVRDGSIPDKVAPSRVTLGATVALLVEVGIVVAAPDGTLNLAQPVSVP
jgi:hypothetical protein